MKFDITSHSHHALRTLLADITRGMCEISHQRQLRKSDLFVNIALYDSDGQYLSTVPFYVDAVLTQQFRWREYYQQKLIDEITRRLAASAVVSFSELPVMDVINFTHAMDQSVTAFDGVWTLMAKRLTLKNGGELSIQASPGHYCSPRDMTPICSYSHYRKFEVGYPSFAVPEFKPWSQSDGIYGWVPAEVIQYVINRCGGTAIPVCAGNYAPAISGRLKAMIRIEHSQD